MHMETVHKITDSIRIKYFQFLSSVSQLAQAYARGEGNNTNKACRAVSA